jgi:hypothetical protein
MYKPYGNTLSITKVKRSETVTRRVGFATSRSPFLSTDNALTSSRLHS